MRGPRRLCAFLSCLVALLAPVQAFAAPTRTGFALNRHQPSEAGSDWFKNESLDLRGQSRLGLSLSADFAYKPLLILDENDEELVAIVDSQFFYHLGASWVLFERLRLSASLPLLLHGQGGRGRVDSVAGVRDVEFSSEEGAGIGDARFGVDLRIAGQYREPFVLAVGARVYAATGDEEQFTSDGPARLEGRLTWAGDAGPFAYAGQLGGVYHFERDDFAALPFGTDLTVGLSLGLRFGERALLGAEAFGSTVISDSGEGFLKRATTPLELLFGGKFHIGESIRLGAGAGPGLAQGLGSPRLRVVASLEWLPPIEEPEPPPEPPLPPPADLDGDGVTDDQDVCPSDPGPARPEEPARNGCPDPPDADGDGIFDPEDACPQEAGLPHADPARHGCKPHDRDEDGIVDELDACPDQVGVLSTDPDKNGCPVDSDADGIIDLDDACPLQAGRPHADPAKNGCPKARVERGEIKITEQVKFASGSARILGESDELLGEVVQVMSEHPEIKLVSVEGHTDNRGGVKLNLRLSQKRAASVVKWLVDHGVSSQRLTSQGYGLERPIDTNETEEGRRNNRRVEFRIVRQDKVFVEEPDDPKAGGAEPSPSPPKP